MSQGEEERPADALDQVWIDRFYADIEGDERQERRLLVKAVVIGLVVAGLAALRWRLL